MHSSSQKLTRADLKVSKKHHWDGNRKGFFIAVGISFCTLQLVVLLVMCLLYGSQYKSELKVHNLHVLAVDYDGGLVGEALSQAYGQMKGDNFPTVDFQPTASYPDVQSLKDVVSEGKYWAAVYTWPGASTRFSEALSGGNAATSFNAQEMVTFVWLEARYPTTSEGYIQSNLNQLISASATAFKRLNGTQALSTLNQSDSVAIQAYLNPIVPSNINLKPTHYGTRVLANTASVALSIVQMFFFVLTINGVSGAMNLFSRLTIITNIVIRQGLAALYTFVAALLEVTYIWAFKEDWQLQGYMFALLWMVNWLHMWVNFTIIDTAACVVPMQYMPYIVVTYIILNITSSLVCIPIAPVFYRYAYAMPSHNWYEIYITITTGGCVNTIYRSLPILFVWFIVGQLIGVPAMTYRCRKAQEATRMLQSAPSSDKTDDIEKLPSDRLSHTTDASDNLAEPSTQQLSRAASTAAVASNPRALNTRQYSDAYFPSIPVGFEAVDRILSRDG